MKTKPWNRDWGKYPLRTCRYFDKCELCGEQINAGQQYRDGGFGRRAHVQCAIDAPKFEASNEPVGES